MKQTFEVENNNLFIRQLPGSVQDQIRRDLETYAKETGEDVPVIDPETGDYLPMSDRFCWIEEIYHEPEEDEELC